jgi:hypothetical protein
VSIIAHYTSGWIQGCMAQHVGVGSLCGHAHAGLHTCHPLPALRPAEPAHLQPHICLEQLFLSTGLCLCTWKRITHCCCVCCAGLCTAGSPVPVAAAAANNAAVRQYSWPPITPAAVEGCQHPCRPQVLTACAAGTVAGHSSSSSSSRCQQPCHSRSSRRCWCRRSCCFCCQCCC